MAGAASTVFLIARGAPGDEPKLKAALETALRELGVEPLPGRGVPRHRDRTGPRREEHGDLISESTAVGIAGGLVLILAALGIVGVVGFMVATRTRELAVRMALGATRSRVLGMMLSDVVKLVIPGVAGGLAARGGADPHHGERDGHAAHRRADSAWRDGARDLRAALPRSPSPSRCWPAFPPPAARPPSSQWRQCGRSRRQRESLALRMPASPPSRRASPPSRRKEPSRRCPDEQRLTLAAAEAGHELASLLPIADAGSSARTARKKPRS